MTRHFLSMPAIFAGLLCSAPGRADVLQSVGRGSAVSIVDATADFEQAVNVPGDYTVAKQPYVENGLTFSTNTTYSGGLMAWSWQDPFIPGATGKQLFAQGLGAFITIATSSLDPLSGLEFLVGDDHADTRFYYSWTASLAGVIVGSGNGLIDRAAVVSFYDPRGFDTLRWATAQDSGRSNDPSSKFYGTMIDGVTAQYAAQNTATAVPEPSALGLFAIGTALLGVAGVQRRRQTAT